MLQVFSKLFLLFTVLLVAACTPETSLPVSKNSGERKVFEGDLVDLVQKTYFGENQDLNSCDQNDRKFAQILATELQSRKAEIEKLWSKLQAETSSGDHAAQFTKIGKYYFRNSKKEIGDDEWITDTYSWAQIYQTYLEIKNQQVNTKWLGLDTAVRQLMSDEEDRVGRGENFALGRKSENLVAKIQSEVESCLQDKACFKVTFVNEELSYINSSYTETKIYNLLQDPQTRSNDKRKELLQYLNKWLKADLNKYRFALNLDIKNQDDRLIVPIDATTFDESARDLKAFLEDVWQDTNKGATGTGLRVDISLVTRPVSSFLIIIQNEIGRAFVNNKSRTMNLYKNTRLKSLAHEFGHVLGLKDRYYTTYDQSTCSYKVEFNPGDLMSEIETGGILPIHWQELSKNYVKKENVK